MFSLPKLRLPKVPNYIAIFFLSYPLMHRKVFISHKRERVGRVET